MITEVGEEWYRNRISELRRQGAVMSQQESPEDWVRRQVMGVPPRHEQMEAIEVAPKMSMERRQKLLESEMEIAQAEELRWVLRVSVAALGDDAVELAKAQVNLNYWGDFIAVCWNELKSTRGLIEQYDHLEDD